MIESLMVLNPVFQEYLASFVLGLSLSLGIVIFTPKQKLITFEEDMGDDDQNPSEQQQVRNLEKTEIKVSSTDSKSNMIGEDTPEQYDSEDVRQYIDNPELPTRHQRNKKNSKVITPSIPSEIASTMGKKPKLKKFFGVSDETIAKAMNEEPRGSIESEERRDLKNLQDVKDDNLQKTPKLSPEARATVSDAKDEILKLIDSQEQLNNVETGLFSVVMFLITVFGILAALLLINIATNGDFGRIIVGMFPRETEALKIRDFLIKFHN